VIHLDTCFLVDLKRERRAGRPGPASARLESVVDRRLAVSTFVAAELHLGMQLAPAAVGETALIRRILEGIDVVHPDERFPPAYGRVAAYLHRNGQRIATMDLLIGVTALVEEAPLLTRDGSSFPRIPGLELITY
jgi:predicted nucleic acid-binding protein